MIESNSLSERIEDRILSVPADKNKQPTSRSLFVNHVVNVDEALDRLEYWANHLANPTAPGAIKMLVVVLKRDRAR